MGHLYCTPRIHLHRTVQVANLAGLRCHSRGDGLHPIDLRRDLYPIIKLIKVAFQDTLDVESERVLKSMRLPRFWLPWFALLDSLSPPGEGLLPGFVWLQGGRVLGTASIRRLDSWSDGWLLSNVAVHPNYQGRGWGRALTEAAAKFAREHAARWITLQARGDNPISRHLYASLGFREQAFLLCLRRPPGLAPCLRPPDQSDLRLARWSDSRALSRLARSLIPSDFVASSLFQQKFYKVGFLDSILDRFRRPKRRWWLACKRGEAYAGVGVEIDPAIACHRLRLLVAPTARSRALAAQLIAFGLHQIAADRRAPPLVVEIEHPAADQESLAALQVAGFSKVWELVHMRLDFG